MALSLTPRGLPGSVNLGGVAQTLLTALLILATVHLFWLLWPADRADLPEGGATAQRAIREPAARVDYEAIAAAHLFGQPARTSAAAEAPRHAPDTHLNLQLRGIALAQEKSASRAIIGAPGSPDRAYTPGDELPGGAMLEEIHSDRVILRNNGRFETLRLSVPGVDGTGVQLDRAPGAQDQPRVVDLTKRHDLGLALRRYRQQLLRDPASLSGLLQVDPESRGGKLVGYRVRENSDLRSLARFGLRAGDVITAVNGVALDSPTAGLKLLQNLAHSERLEFNVMRQEKLVSYYFQIENN